MFYNIVRMNDKAREMQEMEQDNNVRFNELLNACQNPRAVYNALLAVALAKPHIKQADDVSQKCQIIVGEALALLNEPQSNQQVS